MQTERDKKKNIKGRYGPGVKVPADREEWWTQGERRRESGIYTGSMKRMGIS